MCVCISVFVYVSVCVCVGGGGGAEGGGGRGGGGGGRMSSNCFANMKFLKHISMFTFSELHCSAILETRAWTLEPVGRRYYI